MKLDDCFKRMKEFPDVFTLIPQQYENVSNYFQSYFNCKNIPEDFVKFMSIVDGLKLDVFNVFSISANNKPFSVLTFEDDSNEEVSANFMKNLDIVHGSELFIFATDGKGGRYAFKKNKNDNKIYYISTNRDLSVIIFESFTQLLAESIEKEIKKVV